MKSHPYISTAIAAGFIGAVLAFAVPSCVSTEKETTAHLEADKDIAKIVEANDAAAKAKEERDDALKAKAELAAKLATSTDAEEVVRLKAEVEAANKRAADSDDKRRKADLAKATYVADANARMDALISKINEEGLKLNATQGGVQIGETMVGNAAKGHLGEIAGLVSLLIINPLLGALAMRLKKQADKAEGKKEQIAEAAGKVVNSVDTLVEQGHIDLKKEIQPAMMGKPAFTVSDLMDKLQGPDGKALVDAIQAGKTIDLTSTTTVKKAA